MCQVSMRPLQANSNCPMTLEKNRNTFELTSALNEEIIMCQECALPTFGDLSTEHMLSVLYVEPNL